MMRLILPVLFSAAPWLPPLTHAFSLSPYFPPGTKYDKRVQLQDVVTWDQHSLMVRGERLMIYSGEFHPFRLPVPGLWLDVFQKIRALSYNTVSFYVDWALVEGQPGNVRLDGIFALEPFFDAASQAGLYLIARPGPYINAETSGGGFPGWLQRNPGQLRTNASTYLDATHLYVQQVGGIIANSQITNGGPVILLQPENEYSQAEPGVVFPNSEYFAYVEQQYRNAGIVVPFISNDAGAHGYFAPGTGLGAVDLYGYDAYPVRYDCAHPYDWPNVTEGSYFNTEYWSTHRNQSAATPNAIPEFEGGAPDGWGGVGQHYCAVLVGPEAERVFYKNNYAQGVTIFNLYMTFGGTNWGNLGHPGGYTSYDYGAVITEDRQVWREKYSEQKLQANFIACSSAYLTATPQNGTNGTYTSTSMLTTTMLSGNGIDTNFYIVRHAQYWSIDVTAYTLTVATSKGNITIPQAGGDLTLDGRDSKIHVTDYHVGPLVLLYSTAEIFTWQTTASETVLIVYGALDEQHELALDRSAEVELVEGPDVNISVINGSTVISWITVSDRRIVSVNPGLKILILERNDAYNYWVLPLLTVSNTSSAPLISRLVAKAGYLLRNATLENTTLSLYGDLNTTTTLEIITGVPSNVTTLRYNNLPVNFHHTPQSNIITATLLYLPLNIRLPDLKSTTWKYHTSLPEISSGYDDTYWPSAKNFTQNTVRPLTTPVSLYSGDYGFHSGTFVFRGHFTASGNESVFSLTTNGGTAYGHSVWLNDTFLGSWIGNSTAENYTSILPLTGLLQPKHNYVFTIVIDMLGYTMNYRAGDATLMKTPRGIMDYTLSGRPASDISWKLTGNLGGEDYIDKIRGPLNEGGMFAERMGWHLPGSPSDDWEDASPVAQGLQTANIGFYIMEFELDLPRGYDIPLAFVFGNATNATTGRPVNFRAQLFINGYQFGKYSPQTVYPVPEGIINHRGSNWVALTMWALDAGGAHLESFELKASAVVQTGYGDVVAAPQPRWTERAEAY